MAATPLIAAGLSGLAAGGASALLSPKGGLNQSDLADLRGGIQAGGLSSRAVNQNRDIRITADPTRTALVSGLSDVFRSRAGELGEMRGLLSPGFGALTQARRAQIQAAERQALGDLRSNLGRRRVLGSSFAQDREAGIREEFGRAQAELDAESFIQELEANLALFNQQSTAEAAAFETELGELNLQTQVAMGILTSSNAGVAQLANTSMVLQQQFMRDVLGTVSAGIGLLGLGAGSHFGGSGGGTT